MGSFITHKHCIRLEFIGNFFPAVRVTLLDRDEHPTSSFETGLSPHENMVDTTQALKY